MSNLPLARVEKHQKQKIGGELQYGASAMIACATIVRGNRVLLVRHAGPEKPDYGDWLLPAGRVEEGESSEEAVKREIMEETGLRIRTVKELTEIVDPYTKDILVNFLCIPLTSKIEPSSELKEVKWFDTAEVQMLDNIHPGLKQFLMEGFRTRRFVRSRRTR